MAVDSHMKRIRNDSYDHLATAIERCPLPEGPIQYGFITV
jgi:hypothetical protein